MLVHSFDRFYVETKFILPSIGDLDFSKLNYNTYTYLDDRNIFDADTKKYLLNLLVFCKKIELYVTYYKRQIKSYNNIVHTILKNKTGLILSEISRKQKCGIITTIVSSFIGLAYEAISSFPHNKGNKALHKAVKAMDSKTTIQYNKLIQLENSMLIGLSFLIRKERALWSKSKTWNELKFGRWTYFGWCPPPMKTCQWKYVNSVCIHTVNENPFETVNWWESDRWCPPLMWNGQCTEWV